MTEAKRRPKRTRKKNSNDDEPAASAGEPERGPETPPETPSAEAGTAESSKAASRTLPAYGFAEDLLRELRDGGDAGDDPPAPLDGPDRIFAFAERLESSRRMRAEEERGNPVVLETWVTLRLEPETYALPVESVREVQRVSDITRVPHAPQPIRGVTNLRGRVIPVIDLRKRLGLETRELDRSSRVIVTRARGHLIGLLVDAVLQVVHIDLNQVHPPPDDVVTVHTDFVLGVHQQHEALLLLLDVERVLTLQEAGAA